MFVHVVGPFKQAPGAADVAHAVAQCAAQWALVNTLTQHKPAFSHWHWKRPGVSGTLEVTWTAHTGEIRVIVHKNRTGTDGWALEIAPHFAAALANILRKSHVTHRH